jgi:uncharacterized repeat protein (TIGR01451 family)
MTNARRISPALTASLWLSVALGVAVGPAAARQFEADDPDAGRATIGIPPTPPTPAPTLGPGPDMAPGQEPAPEVDLDPDQPAELDPAPVADPAPAPVGPDLPPHIQVVRFTGPPGASIEVLEPAPMPLPAPEHEEGLEGLSVGLQIGTAYRLRVSDIPNRPGEEIFPVIEVVGHLHRPPGIDPVRFPIRVVFGQEDLLDVVDSARMVTQVIYLESPEQALPIAMPKDRIPVTTLGPGEEPLRVADALGRVMAIVRVGGRTPAPGEPLGLGFGSGMQGMGVGPCAFELPGGGHCGLPCGPAVPFNLDLKPQFPTDEYLCDGGDHGRAAGIGPDGRVVGIDPSDSLIRFNAGSRPRVLPTNTVCIYAPRFAAVRTSVGVNQNLHITVPRGAENLTAQMQEAASQPPIRLTQALAPNAIRERKRASAMEGRLPPITHIEVRVLNELSDVVLIDTKELVQGTQVETINVGPLIERKATEALGIKTAEGPVVAGIIQGASETVTARLAGELAGVETPPDLPGLSVVKESDTATAEPGEVVTFTIRWRNIGNVPIHSVSVVDSLLPRFEYVPDSARGPSQAVFTAAENAAGSTELRWDLADPIPPGGEGAVSFQARVR